MRKISSKERKRAEKNKQDIILAVPGFVNQLLLLLNSGLVLQDAFGRILQGYGNLEKGQQNYFTREMYKLYEASQRSGENLLLGFYRFSRYSNVKELGVVANIIHENQSKGVELWDKLAEQGEHLWAERKRQAMNQIRLAESKMSFPLGIFLLSLIIMTAAPAMMQMQ